MAARSSASVEHSFVVNLPPDEENLDHEFSLINSWAAVATRHQSLHDILEEYMPPNAIRVVSPASTAGTNKSGTNPSSQDRRRLSVESTTPTSNGIHDRVQRELDEGQSVAATRTDSEGTFLWGVGSGVGVTTHAEVRVPDRTHSRGLQSRNKAENATFMTTYFPTLPTLPIWRRILLFLNFIPFLFSTAATVYTFRQVSSDALDSIFAQRRLFCIIFVWIYWAAMDGILRLRSREKIAISMGTSMILGIMLSHFVQFMAD